MKLGGQIALTIRKKDGTEYRMERWTNILPDHIHTIDFWKGREDIWDETIKHWQLESSKGSKGKTIISSWEMYKNPYLAPSEYGILVIDYKTMSIVSCQRYIGISHLDYAKIQGHNIFNNNFNKFKDAAMIGKKILEFPGKDKWEVYELINHAWKVYSFKEDRKGYRECKKCIEKLGFILNLEEEKIWRKETH